MIPSKVPAPTTLYDAQYFRIEVDARNGILWVIRTASPCEQLADLDAAQTSVLVHLHSLARRHLALLVDLRLARSRNDPEFEEMVAVFRRELFSLFQRSAILVRTAAGKMQVTRHVRSDGSGARVFDDEGQAVEHLRHK